MYKKVDINYWDEMKNYPKGSYCFDYNGKLLYYRVDGKSHREDGPAVEYTNGDKTWFQNGELHRLDGPACEWANGYKEWYLHGKKYSYNKWKEKVDNYLVYLWDHYV